MWGGGRWGSAVWGDIESGDGLSMSSLPFTEAFGLFSKINFQLHMVSVGSNATIGTSALIKSPYLMNLPIFDDLEDFGAGLFVRQSRRPTASHILQRQMLGATVAHSTQPKFGLVHHSDPFTISIVKVSKSASVREVPDFGAIVR